MKRWFYWWAERPNLPNGGQWFGPWYLTDLEAFNTQLSVLTNTPDVHRIYRWFWDGTSPTWTYDERPDSVMLSSDIRFAWL
jgi:hypothetical protein